MDYPTGGQRVSRREICRPFGLHAIILDMTHTDTSAPSQYALTALGDLHSLGWQDAADRREWRRSAMPLYWPDAAGALTLTVDYQQGTIALEDDEQGALASYGWGSAHHAHEYAMGYIAGLRRAQRG